MSKKRNLRNKSNPSFFNNSCDDHKIRNSSLLGIETIRSKYIPNANKTIEGFSTNLTDFHKEKVFNKNISFFRDSFKQNDPSQLPFMSSLRKPTKYKSCEINRSTICQPFEAAEKSTSNMKIKKNVSDLIGKGTRMSTAYYRWHNKSGVGSKQMTNFECTLRDYNKSWAPNPEEEKFDTRVRPIKYTDVQSKMYQQNELICPRQRRLFKMK